MLKTALLLILLGLQVAGVAGWSASYRPFPECFPCEKPLN